MRIRLAITGRGYHLAGGIPESIELHADCTLQEAIEHVRQLFPSDNPVVDSCLISVAGKHRGTVGAPSAYQLRDGDELIIVAPVAGG